MTRPLFDPDRALGGEPPTPLSDSRTLTVREVASMIGGVLERGLPARLRVVGEISNFNERTHWYFRLKDEEAVIDCVMFASAARRAGFTPRDGRKVILSGRVEFYAKQGRTQFYAESMEPVGAGELERRFRALCEELKALGWFDADRKRPLPTFPRRVAVVTSKTGAALQDVLATMRRRCPAVEVAVVDVRVQGEGAAEEIASALRRLSARHGALGIDAVLLTRGGGSIEDLWAFNERVVAQAIVESAVPVVAAIGHETDVTIADLVADQRAATPTQAAMLLAPDREALSEELLLKDRRLRTLLLRRLERDAERLRGLSKRPVLADPRSIVHLARRTLDHALARLHHAARDRLARGAVRVERLSSRLGLHRPEAVYAARRAFVSEAWRRLTHAMHARLGAVDLSRLASDLDRAWRTAADRCTARIDSLGRALALAGPVSVLERGFSVTTDAQGRVIRSAAQARPGEMIATRVADGSFRSIVAPHDDNARPAQRRPDSPPEQGSLF